MQIRFNKSKSLKPSQRINSHFLRLVFTECEACIHYARKDVDVKWSEYRRRRRKRSNGRRSKLIRSQCHAGIIHLKRNALYKSAPSNYFNFYNIQYQFLCRCDEMTSWVLWTGRTIKLPCGVSPTDNMC